MSHVNRSIARNVARIQRCGRLFTRLAIWTRRNSFYVIENKPSWEETTSPAGLPSGDAPAAAPVFERCYQMGPMLRLSSAFWRTSAKVRLSSHLMTRMGNHTSGKMKSYSTRQLESSQHIISGGSAILYRPSFAFFMI